MLQFSSAAMVMHSLRALATIGIVAAAMESAGASAADLEVEKNVPYYPPPQYQPVLAAPFIIWSGCFVGPNVGVAWARWGLTESTPVPLATGQNAPLAVAGGGQGGCDFQWGDWVFGFQGMFDGATIGVSTTQLQSAPGTSFSANLPDAWIATATGRVGYTIVPPVLLYIKGGPAFAQAENVGWTVGGGLEWKMLPDWSLFVEYGYLGFGAKSVTFAGPPTSITGSYNLNIQTALVGLNYRFDIGPAVTTRY
jgi:outer membrane immunogenic protein